MSETLDDLYLQYLYDSVELPKRGRDRTYWGLFRQMYSCEFVWKLMKDSSRAEDGKELRWEFIRAAGLPKVDAAWLYQPCTILEMMIAVARRLSSLTSENASAWFIQLLYNIKLDEFNDAHYDSNMTVIADILERLIWRMYWPNGEGGLFPLRHPAEDQRNVEIWYQMNAWLIERDRREG